MTDFVGLFQLTNRRGQTRWLVRDFPDDSGGPISYSKIFRSKERALRVYHTRQRALQRYDDKVFEKRQLLPPPIRYGSLPSAAPIIENPDVHIELPPFYVDPRLVRNEPTTPSPAKEEPGLAQWQAVALIGVVLIAILVFYLFLAYPALRDWTPLR